MANAQIPTIEYAVHAPASRRVAAWILSLCSVALPPAGSLVIVFIAEKTKWVTSTRGVLVIMSFAVAVQLGTIACGWLGRHYALRSNVKGARWVALSALLIGALTLCGQLTAWWMTLR